MTTLPAVIDPLAPYVPPEPSGPHLVRRVGSDGRWKTFRIRNRWIAGEEEIVVVDEAHAASERAHDMAWCGLLCFAAGAVLAALTVHAAGGW
jgi:hypothetical protein